MFPVVYGIELTTRRIAAYATITVALTLRDDAHRRGRPVLRGVGPRARRDVRDAGASRCVRDPTPKRAIQFFGWSNVYLMLVFVAVAVDALVR